MPKSQQQASTRHPARQIVQESEDEMDTAELEQPGEKTDEESEEQDIFNMLQNVPRKSLMQFAKTLKSLMFSEDAETDLMLEVRDFIEEEFRKHVTMTRFEVAELVNKKWENLSKRELKALRSRATLICRRLRFHWNQQGQEKILLYYKKIHKGKRHQVGNQVKALNAEEKRSARRNLDTVAQIIACAVAGHVAPTEPEIERVRRLLRYYVDNNQFPGPLSEEEMN